MPMMNLSRSPHCMSRTRSSNKRPKFVTRASKTPDVNTTYLEFAEKINGRSAMQGFIWGAVREATTGKTIIQQLFDNNNVSADGFLHLIGIVGLVTLGTAVTEIFPNQELAEESAKVNAPQFNNKAELINGRRAMIGFLILSTAGLLSNSP